MFRSVVVSFALIALWIIGIVYFQVRSEPVPDFRPQAEAIFVAMRDGRAERVYDEASTRFQELVLEETFLTRVDDMNRTLGRFVEVASVMRTQVYRGPSGRIARMELLLTFQRGDARANVSFYLEGGRWRMLGYGVALPDDVVADATSEQARQERSQAPPEIGELTQQILELSRDGRAGEVWEAAAPVFRDSISKEAFLRLEAERREVLGAFEVILKTGVAPPVSRISPSGSTASYDALLEYRGPSGASVTVSGRFKFQKLDGAWKLSFYKVILPLPRGGDEVAAPGGGGEVAPP